jgi:putative methionine-R-sulfoxide reductase with GAF domain
MNFLRNRSLRDLGLLMLGALLIIFLIEFLVLRSKIRILDEIEEKKDFARSAQIEGQQLAYLIQSHVHGQPGLTADIYSRITEQDHKLAVLGKGGRIDNTEIFIEPLSRLPKITFDHLLLKWNEYKGSVNTLLTPPQQNDAALSDTSQVTTDSLVSTKPVIIDPVDQVKALLPGQWLTLATWYENLMKDLTAETEKKKDTAESWFLFFVILDTLLLASLYYLFHKFVLTPLNKLKSNTAQHLQDNEFPKNEIGGLATEVNEILEQLKDATEFVAAIGEGKLDYDYKILDSEYATGKNRLADSLISMQVKLKTLNEEEQRRQWANEGLTKFVDILRSSDDNITTLGDKIISALVKYTNSNQGGLYVLNDDDEHQKFLELISLFAFDLKKYETRKVKLGEGILGQTFLEKETTILNEIPQEYIRITSGLGEANPKSLLMVPLKVDKEVYGIVELASFKNYQPHEITFVEKLAETIASTLASVKVGQKNRHLIEQFQQQTEEMRAQEEEMRQNMEELQATQEELSRKELDYLGRIKELEAQIGEGVTTPELERVKEELKRKEEEFHQKVRDLEKKLAEKPAQGDDWALASQVEKELRLQLEALKITQDELDRNAGE